MKKCIDCKKEKEDWEFETGGISKTTGRTGTRRICPQCFYKRQKVRKGDRHGEHIKYRFGISEVDFETMLKAQENKCAICGSADPNNNWAKHLVIDHCHKTNKIRGLLCAKCNRGLGYFDDSSEVLRKAVKYLEKQ